MQNTHRRKPKKKAFFRWLALSALFNLAIWVGMEQVLETPASTRNPGQPFELVFLEPPEKAKQEKKEKDVKGQIVDLPDPETKERPKDADYLAEADRMVEEETRTRNHKLNPDVLAPEFSEESKLEFENLIDIGAQTPSTGAKVGNDRFDPQKDGNLAALPSPYQLTNKDGLQQPTISSHRARNIAGAPNNDLLDEEIGTAVNLNTKEFLYANYINQIRRLVNFYWRQQLDNLPRSLRINKPRYTTVVKVLLNEDGLLDSIELLQTSGVGPLDNAVVEAFKIAGPYPEPPEGLIDGDGRARISDFGFTVEIGQANSAYQGIDPRSGVQFPGILKSPR